MVSFQSMNNNALLTIRYEDLSSVPLGVITKVFKFLEVDSSVVNSEFLKISKKNGNSGASFITKKTPKFRLIKSIKLDEFVKKVNNKTLIWIDVQGYEGKVIEGSKELIKKKIPFVIEFWPYAIKRNHDLNLIKTGLKRFKYEYTHPQMAPRLYTSDQNGKKYIIPTYRFDINLKEPTRNCGFLLLYFKLISAYKWTFVAIFLNLFTNFKRL